MDMTIREAGASGVELAIADGMKAAEYARALDAMTKERDALEKKCAALMNENAGQADEITKLRQRNRNYRFSRSRAYQAYLNDHGRGVSYDALSSMVFVGIGAVVTFAICFAIVWIAGLGG